MIFLFIYFTFLCFWRAHYQILLCYWSRGKGFFFFSKDAELRKSKKSKSKNHFKTSNVLNKSILLQILCLHAFLSGISASSCSVDSPQWFLEALEGGCARERQAVLPPEYLLPHRSGLEVVSLCPLSMHGQWLFNFSAMVQVQKAAEMRFSFKLSSLCVCVCGINAINRFITQHTFIHLTLHASCVWMCYE